jgi:hypothetical protein
MKCPRSFCNPAGPIDCIKTDCPIWVGSRKYMRFTHPRHDELYSVHYRKEEQELLAIPGINDQEPYTVPAHCGEFGAES